MDTVTREQLISLGATIRQTRQELARLEAEFDAIAGGTGRASPLVAASGSASDSSIPQRILARMRAEPTKLFGAEDFEDLRGDSSVQTLRSALLRLYDGGRGVIERPERGHYRMRAAQNGAHTSSSRGTDLAP